MYERAYRQGLGSKKVLIFLAKNLKKIYSYLLPRIYN
jgi:hypothetical protein